MKPQYIFPMAMILLSLGAAIMYLIAKDYKKSIYWTAAEIITATVTF